MPTADLKAGFRCSVFRPYVNADKPPSDHLAAIEVGWFVCAALHMLIAFRTKRVFTLLGIYLFGIIFESVGFGIQSVIHNQYRIMLTCYLPLKEVFWYGTTSFMGLVAAEHSGFRSKVSKVALCGLLAALQNFSYEMVSSLDGVENYYVNDFDFPANDFSDKINGATAAVVIYYTLLVLSIATVALTCKDVYNVFLVPLAAAPLAFVFIVPYHLFKYAGCGHIYKEEPTFEKFHLRCNKYSFVKDSAIVPVLAVTLIVPIMLGLKNQVYEKKLDSISQLAMLAVALISHGVILFNLLAGSQLSYSEKFSQPLFFVSVAMFQLTLLFVALSPSLRLKTIWKDKRV